jgi:hypothetical protein
MKKLILIVSAVALAVAAIGFGSGLKLRPGTVGNGADAYWMPDGSRPADHVLVLRKNVPTSEWEAAGADISGVAGYPVETLTGLSWDLVSGSAGGGSPRWNVYYGQPGAGIEGYVFLEPAAYDSDGVGAITAAEIDANPNWVGRDILEGDVIYYIQVIVDEQEEIVLDDITIELDGVTTVFSGPGKSGQR